MNYYETIYIVVPNIENDALKVLTDEFENLVKNNNSKVLKNEVWGKRNLAYPIKKFKQGFYIIMHHKSEVGVVKILENRFRIKDNILRFMTVTMSKKDIMEYAKKQETTDNTPVQEPTQKEKNLNGEPE